jgi:hypothetical protein
MRRHPKRRAALIEVQLQAHDLELGQSIAEMDFHGDRDGACAA